jgi:hypothetical protein
MANGVNPFLCFEEREAPICWRCTAQDQCNLCFDGYGCPGGGHIVPFVFGLESSEQLLHILLQVLLRGPQRWAVKYEVFFVFDWGTPSWHRVWAPCFWLWCAQSAVSQFIVRMYAALLL